MVGATAENTGAIAVAVRATVCGLEGALSVKTRLAVRLPPAVGLKVKVKVQVPEGAIGELAKQLSAITTKSPGFVPDFVAAALKVRLALPVFVTVTV
jgi:hypothetical protein